MGVVEFFLTGSPRPLNNTGVKLTGNLAEFIVLFVLAAFLTYTKAAVAIIATTITKPITRGVTQATPFKEEEPSEIPATAPESKENRCQIRLK